MSIFGWFKSPAQKAAAANRRLAEARLRSMSVLGAYDRPEPGRAYPVDHERQLYDAGIGDVRAARARRAAYERSRVMDEIDGMTTLMTAKSQEEARAYHYALDLVRERGPAEASRIAGLVVRYVNLLSRG